MRVVNTEPFELIYSLVKDPYLGYSIEPHVVQANAKGDLTLTHQRVFSHTLGYFESKITAEDRAIITQLDQIEADAIFKKFYPTSGIKKKIKAYDYYSKYLDKDFFLRHIRPFIERRIVDLMPELTKKPLFKKGKDGNPAHQKIKCMEGEATVLFHFIRNEEGTRYFATLKHDGERVDFIKKESWLLATEPTWLLIDNELFYFRAEMDGKKLSPFMDKPFIEVQPKAEDKFYGDFAVKLLERFDVRAQGITIYQEQFDSIPVLSLEQVANEFTFQLAFQYGGTTFHYHNLKKTHVRLEKKADQYIFHKIRRNTQKEDQLKDLLLKLGLSQKDGSSFFLKDSPRLACFSWLSDHLDALKNAGFQITQNASRNYFLGSHSMVVNLKETGDWFDIKINVKFGEFNIPFLKLREYILKGQREFELPDGQIAVIPEEWFTRYLPIFEKAESDAEGLHLKKYHFGLIQEIAEHTGMQDASKQKLKLLEGFEQIPEEPLPVKLQAQLRPYQKAGYDWFYFLKRNNLGGILADDMGLGKTIQTLALLCREIELFERQQPSPSVFEKPKQMAGIPQQIGLFDDLFEHINEPIAPEDSKEERPELMRPSLLILPTSLVYNWFNEIRKFAPHLKVLLHIGQNRARNFARFQYFELIITTYGTARQDMDTLKEMRFHYLILDESQAIKNPASQTAKALDALEGDYRLALTGTPVENSVNDLWAQMNFVNKGLLGSFHHFQEHFAIPIEKEKDEEKLKLLKTLVNPFILRRTKQVVATDLPEKSEQLRYCEMTPSQKNLYEETKAYYRNQLLESIENRSFTRHKFSILQGLVKLRQIANHTRLVGAEHDEPSGKFEMVRRQVEMALSEGHKILIFSQFVQHLAIYKEYFTHKDIPFAYIDGQIPNKERQVAVDSFQKKDDIKLFLSSLKAGGYGLNLTAADYVFILDPWWNPATERQAQDRSHRIGQDKPVFIFKYISKNTIEEKILLLQERKSALADQLISQEEGIFKKLNTEELLQILS